MIAEIEVRRFKGIDHLPLTVEGMNVLVGANNSGKSSILQALHFTTSLLQSRRLLAEAKTAFTIASQQILYTPLADVTFISPDGNLTQDKEKETSISLRTATQEAASVSIRRGKNRNLAVGIQVDPALLRQMEDVTSPFSVYVPGLAGISKTEHLISRGLLTRAVARGDANLVLRNVLLLLNRNREKWAQFSQALDEVFPGIEISIRFEEETDEFISAQIIGKRCRLPLDAAGTGLLQTAQILSYFYLFSPRLALLDEPDSHLHPNNQRALSKLLVRLAEAGTTQFMIATHSRHVLDVLHERSRVIWLKNGKAVEHTKHVDILLDIGALDSAEGLISGSVKYVVLTEDERTLPIKTITESLGLSGQVQIWSYKGCTKTETASALGSFIHEVSPSAIIVVHRDSDYLEQDQMDLISKEYGAEGLRVFYPAGVDIESIFCNIDHLKAANPEHADILDEVFEEAWNAAGSQLRKETISGAIENYNLRAKKRMSQTSEADLRKWAQDQDLRVERWVKGKVLVPRLRDVFKTKTGQNLKIFATSEHLRSCGLGESLGIGAGLPIAEPGTGVSPSVETESLSLEAVIS